MRKDALISTCGEYRYWLTRIWGFGSRLCAFCQLNPSIADASINDPTIRRNVAFSKDWGFDGLIGLNAFAYRATNPADMLKHENPIGPENDNHLIKYFTNPDVERIVLAWGNHGSHLGRSKQIADMIVTLGSDVVDKVVHLGKTKSGEPKHPLYLRADTEPRRYFTKEPTNE